MSLAEAAVLASETPAPSIDQGALQKVETEGSVVESRAAEFLIETQADHDLACALEREWAEKEQVALALVNPVCEANHKAWKASVALRDRLAGAFERARRTLKGKLGAWREQQERRAQEEAQRLRAQAQRQVEEEALARAQRAQDAGRPREAEAMLTILPAAPVVTAAPRLAALGVSTRKVWSAEVYDLDALIRWVAENPVQRRQYLMAALPALNLQAKALKEVMNTEPPPIPGVRATYKHC